MMTYLVRPTVGRGGISRLLAERETLQFSEAFIGTDEAIKAIEGLEVLLMEVSSWLVGGGALSQYGRDCLVQWGDALAVKPALWHWWGAKSGFEKIIQKTNFQGRIIVHPLFSEGGMFVGGRELVLASEVVREQDSEFRRFLEEADMDVSVCYLPVLSSVGGRHIDLDYSVVDEARIIYVSDSVFERGDEDANRALETLEGVADRNGFEVKRYPVVEVEAAGEEEGSWARIDELLLGYKGINGIVAGRTFVSNLIPVEVKEDLVARGMRVEEVPLTGVDAGAGLRCVYGQFTVE